MGVYRRFHNGGVARADTGIFQNEGRPVGLVDYVTRIRNENC